MAPTLALLQQVRTLDAVDAGHPPVEQHHAIRFIARVRARHLAQRVRAIDGGVGPQAEGAAHRGQYLARAGVVVDDQHAAALQVRMVHQLRLVMRGLQVEAQAEVETAARAVRALHRDLAAHQAHQMAADRQPQARAAIAAAGGGIGLRKRLEQPALLLGRHADARVANLEAQADRCLRALDDVDADSHLAALGELDGVVPEIEQHLAQARRIAHQGHGQLRRLREQQLDALLLRAHAHQVRQAVEHVAEVERDRLDVQLAGLDLREVQDVVDDAQQRLGRPVDPLDVVHLLPVEPALQGQVRHAQDRVHRRADLVAHVGQEVALGLVGGIGLLLGDDQFGRALVDHVFQVLAVAQQFLVDALLLRDVARDAEQELRLAVHVEDGDLHRVHDAGSVTRVDGLLRDVDHLARRQHRAILQREEVGLVLGEHVVDVLADELLARIAQELLARLVEADEAQGGRVLDEDHVGHVLDDVVEEMLAGPRGLLRMLAIGDLGALAGQRRAEFGRALRDAGLELEVELVQRVLGQAASPAVLEELLHGARHVGDLVAALDRQPGLHRVADAVAQHVAHAAQPPHDMPAEEHAGDQPGQQQADGDLPDDPATRPVRFRGQLLHRIPVVTRQRVRQLLGRRRQRLGLARQAGVGRG